MFIYVHEDASNMRPMHSKVECIGQHGRTEERNQDMLECCTHQQQRHSATVSPGASKRK